MKVENKQENIDQKSKGTIKFSLGISASSQDGVTGRLDLPSYLKQPKGKQTEYMKQQFSKDEISGKGQ